MEAEKVTAEARTVTIDTSGPYGQAASSPTGHVTTYSYDRTGALAGVADPLGRSTTSIPKSRGGDATEENGQTTCGWCNRSKNNSDFPKNPPPGYRGPWPPPWWGLGG